MSKTKKLYFFGCGQKEIVAVFTDKFSQEICLQRKLNHENKSLVFSWLARSCADFICPLFLTEFHSNFKSQFVEKLELLAPSHQIIVLALHIKITTFPSTEQIFFHSQNFQLLSSFRLSSAGLGTQGNDFHNAVHQALKVWGYL